MTASSRPLEASLHEQGTAVVLRPAGNPDLVIYSSRLVNLLLTSFIAIVTLTLLTTVSIFSQ